MERVKKKKAYILGAGPMGLVMAWQLLLNDWDVEVFEKSNISGGMCRSWKWEEFILDTGPHIYHTPDRELAELWEKEFGDLFVKGEFWCKNVQGKNFDTYWDYPISWESISKYPADLKLSILNELKARNPDDKARATNYSDYIRAEVGPTLQKMFFEKYPKKIWGIDPADLTSNWAPKRIEFREKITPFYYQQWNAVGKYGTGCVYDRIREKIETLGGKIHFNSTVNGFDFNDQTIEKIKIVGKDDVKISKEDKVISTLPITLTGKLLGVPSQLQFRGICSVYLAYNKPYCLPDGLHWLYYDSEEVLFNRVTEGKRLSVSTCPADKTVLTAEITYSKNDDIDCANEDELVRLVVEQMEKVGLGKKSDFIKGTVNKEPFVYPLQFAGYQDDLANLRAEISKYNQLYSLGTGGDFYYSDSQVIFHKAFDLVEVLCDKNSSSVQSLRVVSNCEFNNPVEIGGKKVGGANRAYIIAEAGLNHNGSLEVAKKLIDEAVAAKCDAVKFQTFKAASRVSKKVKTARYAETITGLEETIYEMFDRLSMPFEEQTELFQYAKEKEIEIFSTPFDHESVDFLEKMGVSVYKIASMDLVNLPLIRYVAQTGKPIIVSTGMSTFGQIEEAVEEIRKAGNPNLILLHCNSSYPAAPKEMNLRMIHTLKEAFKVPVGLSDHTLGLFASHTALAIGANCIERHFTLDRTMEGPDHILSSEPDEMARLVAMTREIPEILGDGIKRIQPNEYNTLNMQRKSLYAKVDIRKGDVFSEENIVIKGPGGGILPKYMDIVCGRKAQQDIEADYPISWQLV